ncbi:MAG: hypothetical protein ACQER7_06280 [Bacteroidota bacterium]
MTQLKRWLNNPDRSYAEGVEMYKRHKGADQFFKFFSQKKEATPKDPEYKMLVQRLTRLERVLRQQKKKQKPEEKAKAQGQKPIKTDKISNVRTPGHVKGMRNNTKYVSKLLSLNWKDFEQRDKEVFFNNKAYFEYKKKLFIENSDIEKKLKSLHASLKNQEDKNQRKVIVSELKSLEDAKGINWEKIDDWESEMPEEEKEKDPTRLGAELQKKKDNLKASIRRTKNKLSKNHYKTEKTKKNAQQRVEEMEKELEKLENETA